MAKKQKSSPLRALKIVIIVIVLAGVLAYFGPWLTATIGVFNSSLILAVLIVAYFQSETDDLSARLEYIEKKVLGASAKEPR
jgi:Flp pilus assembly protein TadB